MQEKIIYPISGDPYHKGHHTIFNKGKKIYNDGVKILLYQNPLKDNGLLDLSQRYKDLIITELVYHIKNKQSELTSSQALQTIKSAIIVPSSIEEAIAILKESHIIIRGVRGQEDREYTKKLGSIVSPDIVNKVIFIDQDKEFYNTSSHKFKRAFIEFCDRGLKIPSTYNFIDQNLVYEKILSSKIDNIELSKELLQEIIDYFHLVELYQEKGHLKDIQNVL